MVKQPSIFVTPEGMFSTEIRFVHEIKQYFILLTGRIEGSLSATARVDAHILSVVPDSG